MFEQACLLFVLAPLDLNCGSWCLYVVLQLLQIKTVCDGLRIYVQVCASNFGEVCNVVGVQNSEEILVSLKPWGR